MGGYILELTIGNLTALELLGLPRLSCRAAFGGDSDAVQSGGHLGKIVCGDAFQLNLERIDFGLRGAFS